MKVWVVVYNYRLVNEGVGVFGSLEDARQGFREYTGFGWTPEKRWKEVGGEEYSKEMSYGMFWRGNLYMPKMVDLI